MRDTLKDCPFCGEQGWSRYEGEIQTIFCNNVSCPLRKVGFTREKWQRRPIEDQLRAQRNATAADLLKAGEELKAAREQLCSPAPGAGDKIQ